MKDIILITISSIKSNLKSKVLTIVFISITLMIVIGLNLFFCLLLIAPELNRAVPDKTKLEIYLSLIMYTTFLICLGINLNIFAFQSMVREKTRGNIESLMATPLNVRYIWLAKSLAVFIPGMILGELLTLAAMLTVNCIYFIPKTGFIYNYWIGLNIFLFVPLIYLSLSLLVHLIGLTGKMATGNVIGQIFLPIILTLMINLMTRNILSVTSWSFPLANFGLAAVIIIIVMFLQPRLTRERIILSR